MFYFLSVILHIFTKHHQVWDIILIYLLPFLMLMQSVVLLLFELVFICLSILLCGFCCSLIIQIISTLPKLYHLPPPHVSPTFFSISSIIYLIFQVSYLLLYFLFFVKHVYLVCVGWCCKIIGYRDC